MTYRQAVGELKAKFPKADVSPAVMFGRGATMRAATEASIGKT